MDWLTDSAIVQNADQVLSGFWMTLKLLAMSSLIAIVVGTLGAVARVSPVPVLRWAGATYVTLIRNTPLLILVLIAVFGIPSLGINLGLFVFISSAMGIYTGAFVTEALRSGINGIGMGQAEAARSIGMPFSMTMTQVVLPQAFRLVVPPLANVFIALTKNTSIAAVAGLAEATFRMDGLLRDFASQRIAIFIGIALGYIVIVEVISFGASRLEKRWS